MYYLCSENKSADQLRSAPLFFACAKGRFSQDAAHLSNLCQKTSFYPVFFLTK